MSIWETLGIGPTESEREVKKAYARRLKTLDLEKDRDEFHVLREAYEAALARCRGGEAVRTPNAASGDHGDREGGRKEEDGAAVLFERLLGSLRESETAALRTLTQLYDSGELSSTGTRERLEYGLFRLLGDPNLRLFPGAVARLLLERAEWMKDVRFFQEHQEEVHRIEARIQAYDHMRYLIALSRGDAGDADEQAAARALLGPLDEGSFRKGIFASSLLAGVRELLEGIEADHPELLAYELDTPTVLWWRGRVTRPVLRRAHFWGLLWGALCIAPLLRVFFGVDLPTGRDQVSGWLLLAGLAACGLGFHWGIDAFGTFFRYHRLPGAGANLRELRKRRGFVALLYAGACAAAVLVFFLPRAPAQVLPLVSLLLLAFVLGKEYYGLAVTLGLLFRLATFWVRPELLPASDVLLSHTVPCILAAPALFIGSAALWKRGLERLAPLGRMSDKARGYAMMGLTVVLGFVIYRGLVVLVA